MLRIFQYPLLIYLVTGGLNTAISLALYYLMLKVGINYLVATSGTYIFGIIEGYIFSSLWVFKHSIKISGLFKYSGVYLISFVVNLLAMYIIVDIFMLNKFLAQVITIAVLTILNYQLVKVFVFRRYKCESKG